MSDIWYCVFSGQLKILEYGVWEIIPEGGTQEAFADCFAYRLLLDGTLCLRAKFFY